MSKHVGGILRLNPETNRLVRESAAGYGRSLEAGKLVIKPAQTKDEAWAQLKFIVDRIVTDPTQ